jgi:hypothetical protein
MSLLGSKSAKKKSPAEAPAAAAPKPARGVVVEKPKANIYTVLLILTFAAIVVGCICLYAEMSAYEFNIKAS